MISKDTPNQPESRYLWDEGSKVFADFVLEYFGPAVRREIEHHHLDGRAVAIWRDGQLVELNPDGSITVRDPSESA